MYGAVLYSLFTITLVFIGFLNDKNATAGAGIGLMYSSCFIRAIIVGFDSGVGTLVSQSYGSQNYKMCGVYLNRGRLSILALFPYFILAALASKKVLIFFN